MSDLWVSTDRDIVRGLLDRLGMDRPAMPMIFGDDLGVIAIFGFESYTGTHGSVSVHAVVLRPGKISRFILRTLWDYTFNVLGVNVAVANVRASNHEGVSFVDRLGFFRVASLPYFFPDDDAVIYYGTRDSLSRLIRRGKAETTETSALRADARTVGEAPDS